MAERQFSTDASHQRFLAIAEKIEANPGLLEIPLANIPRWLARDASPAPRLEQWRTIIAEAQSSPTGMEALLKLLRDDGEEAVHLKAFSPFSGILTRSERDRLSCSYAH